MRRGAQANPLPSASAAWPTQQHSAHYENGGEVEEKEEDASRVINRILPPLSLDRTGGHTEEWVKPQLRSQKFRCEF